MVATVHHIEHHRSACSTNACERRVSHRITLRRWRAAAAPWRGWLDATGRCESGSVGGYSLRTTYNGFWFRYQFTPPTWRASGGKLGLVKGRLEPIGGWRHRLHPSRAEQDYRAVVTLGAQGKGAWPICGRH